MRFVESQNLNDALIKELLFLWNSEYPACIGHSGSQSLIKYLDGLHKAKHTLVYKNEQIAAWYWEFNRNQEQNFAILVSSSFQKMGVGKALLNKAKEKHNELNGWVVLSNNLVKTNGQVYSSPISFYEKNDFSIFYNEVWETDVIKTVKIKWQRKAKKNNG